MKARRCFLLSVCVLVLFTVARGYGLLGPPVETAAVLMGALILVAWTTGATLADLGLARADVGAGLLHDSRAQISGGRLLYALGVSIVLFTAIPEEFAFRGVLLGSALRMWGPWRASLVTSVLFGLWHIAPTLHTMSDNRAVRGLSATAGGQALLVLGSIAVTSVAGLVFCWLRLRSRSLIAPIMAHAAINGLALTVAWFAVH